MGSTFRANTDSARGSTVVLNFSKDDGQPFKWWDQICGIGDIKFVLSS